MGSITRRIDVGEAPQGAAIIIYRYYDHSLSSLLMASISEWERHLKGLLGHPGWLVD